MRKMPSSLVMMAFLGSLGTIFPVIAEEPPPPREVTEKSRYEPFLRWAGFGRKKPTPAPQSPVVMEIPAGEVIEIGVPNESVPYSSSEIAVVPPLTIGCGDENCPPYYRNRPEGHKKQQKRIMLQNRLGEPEWYRYYRCQHFGYHPTHWMPWPEGWMTCRNPKPGPHPYDLKQPMPKGARPAPPSSRSAQAEETPPRQQPPRLPEPGTLPPVPPPNG